MPKQNPPPRAPFIVIDDPLGSIEGKHLIGFLEAWENVLPVIFTVDLPFSGDARLPSGATCRPRDSQFMLEVKQVFWLRRRAITALLRSHTAVSNLVLLSYHQ